MQSTEASRKTIILKGKSLWEISINNDAETSGQLWKFNEWAITITSRHNFRLFNRAYTYHLRFSTCHTFKFLQKYVYNFLAQLILGWVQLELLKFYLIFKQLSTMLMTLIDNDSYVFFDSFNVLRWRVPCRKTSHIFEIAITNLYDTHISIKGA
jgi:hypothetical protein